MNKIDNLLIACFSQLSTKAASYGVKFPLLISAWIFAFTVNLFCVGAWVAVTEKSLGALLPIAIAVVFAEALRKRVIMHLADSKKEWSKALYEKYAAVALKKREGLVIVRLGVLAFIVIVVLPGMVVEVVNNGDTISAGLALLSSALILLVGSYFDACEPPLPGDGEKVAAGRAVGGVA